MTEYAADLEKCRQLQNSPVSFTTFAAPKMPIYIRRLMELEQALDQIGEIIRGLKGE